MLTIRADFDVARDVLREIEWCTGPCDVSVRSEDGIVTLMGFVDSYARKMAAQEAAHRVGGVTDVANDIEVRISDEAVRSDSEIAHAVRNGLEWDALLPDDRIVSSVSDGVVTLEGEVDRLSERADAEFVVRRLSGVQRVVNKIVIRAPEANPEELRMRIEEALERRALREAERIKVRVSDGIVTVSGRVNSWNEKRAVIGSIAHAPGVARVKDDLSIAL
ncbi:MAG TPA: BON domain-containing protein [Blastocatellia bacterium]|nr:BON domain-containing protein [Blastocatellia bacterium]